MVTDGKCCKNSKREVVSEVIVYFVEVEGIHSAISHNYEAQA
jgi:hypothetical protein